MAEYDGDHQVARSFSIAGLTIVQCDCGERFKGISHEQAMRDQFRHAWAKVKPGG